jgi:hypothetical protein
MNSEYYYRMYRSMLDEDAKQKENDMAFKYYSASKSDWIDISTMNDVHLKNAFMALCREHNCDFDLISTSPFAKNRFLLLIENNSVALEMWIEMAKRFVKMV